MTSIGSPALRFNVSFLGLLKLELPSVRGSVNWLNVVLDVSQIPVGDNSLKLWLRPVVLHGESKLRYGIDQETLLVQEQQKKLRLDELDFVQRIRLGQTLVVTTTSTPAGMGQTVFCVRAIFLVAASPVDSTGSNRSGRSFRTRADFAPTVDQPGLGIHGCARSNALDNARGRA